MYICLLILSSYFSLNLEIWIRLVIVTKDKLKAMLDFLFEVLDLRFAGRRFEISGLRLDFELAIQSLICM